MTKKFFLTVFSFLAIFFVFFSSQKTSAQTPNSFFGINSFISNRYTWQEWGKPADIISDLRISWIREEFVWNQIEPSRGSFDFIFYDRALEEISKHNFNVVGILDYCANWASSAPNEMGNRDKYPPQDLSEWENYVSRVVSRYKDKIKYWQIWNEENIANFWQPAPSATAYLKILKSSYKTIKKIDPNAQIILGGLSGVDTKYLKELKNLGAGDWFDILAAHPYRLEFVTPPELNGYREDLASLDSEAAFFGKPGWITEIGWPTDNKEGVTEALQADYLSRTYLLALSYPRIKKIFWYDLRDDGEDTNSREQNFGIIKRNYSQKPSYQALKTLINILDGANFVAKNKNGENGVFDYRFTKNNKEIAAIWKIEGTKKIRLKTNSPEIILINQNGEQKKLFPASGGIEIEISSSPIFVLASNIASGPNSIEFLTPSYKFQLVDQSPYPVVIKGETASLKLIVKNTGSEKWLRQAKNPVKLGTSRPKDRPSQFFHHSWGSTNRPTPIDQETVGSGEIGTFTFLIDTSNLEPGIFREYFQPVVDGITWMEDIGIYWDIFIISSPKSINSYWPGRIIRSAYVDQSPYLKLKPGEEADLWLKIRNLGNTVWDQNIVRLGTTNPQDRPSPFSHPSWLSPNRIKMNQPQIYPGDLTTFNFKIRAPNNPGSYKEYFRLVADGITWFEDFGIYWQINVE